MVLALRRIREEFALAADVARHRHAGRPLWKLIFGRGVIHTRIPFPETE